MNKEDRTKASNLETILSRHARRQEQIDGRTLIDLRIAGFTNFHSVKEAYERLEAQRELPGFTQSQIDMVMYQRRSRQKRGLAA